MKVLRTSGYDPIARETAMTEAMQAFRTLQRQVNNGYANSNELKIFVAELRDFLNQLEEMS